MALNATELMVLSTKVMRFDEQESLAYLKTRGATMDRSTYYRILGRIDAKTRERLYHIAKNLKDIHLDKIDELYHIKDELWENYHREAEPMNRTRILHEIKEILPYLSAYEEATQGLIEESVRLFGKEEDINLSSLGV